MTADRGEGMKIDWDKVWKSESGNYNWLYDMVPIIAIYEIQNRVNAQLRGKRRRE